MKVGTVRPYPPTGLTSEQWRDIEPTFVAFADLTTTQDGIYLHALLGHAEPKSGDTFPHVVAHEGVLYLEDGHTRAARRRLLGHRGIWARVLRR